MSEPVHYPRNVAEVLRRKVCHRCRVPFIDRRDPYLCPDCRQPQPKAA